MRVSLYGQRYAAWLQQDAYFRELLQLIEAIPGVEAAGLHLATLNTAVKVEGAPFKPPGEEPYYAVQAVSVGYLRAMGVPLVRGTWPRDESFNTFLVNESFVHATLGNENPIGRHLSGSVMNGTIVGVVADFKTWQLDADPSPEVYIPYQLPPSGRSARVVVRTYGDPKLIVPTIRKLAAETDPTQPLTGLQTLDRSLSDSIAPRRFNLFLLGIFAAVALTMALVGVYGVTGYVVSQRTREIGIRMALGAKPADALRLIMAQGLSVALVGVVGGLAGAFALTRFLASLLYGVRPDDPVTFVTVSTVLVGVALTGIYIPARRATKVDPMVALRYE